jgi:hypothetical protein
MHIAVTSASGWASVVSFPMASDSNELHRYTITLQNISEALVTSGFTSLDEQAKALGVHRATAWTIVKHKHKLGRLNRETVNRILANPTTPQSVRSVVEQYVAERFNGSERSNMR